MQYEYDLNHTLDALLASARLMDGFNISSESILSEESAVALLLAVTYHDSGYIQKSDDIDGTGAKYTKNHVERSTIFVTANKDKIGITALMSDVISSLDKMDRPQKRYARRIRYGKRLHYCRINHRHSRSAWTDV